MVLTVFICLFACASGTYAADPDSVNDNNQSLVDVDIPVMEESSMCGFTGCAAESPVADECFMCSFAGSVADILPDDVSQMKSEAQVSNESLGWAINDVFSTQLSINNTDNPIFANSPEQSVETQGLCEHGDCSHDMKGNIKYNAVVAGEGIGDYMVHSYGYYTQICTASVMIVPRNVDEDETRIRNLKSILAIDCSQGLSESNCEGNLTSSGMDMNGNAVIDYADSLYNNSSGFDYDGLKVNLYCDRLDVTDYNLEYSIIANPDLIIANSSTGCRDAYDFSATGTLTFNNNIYKRCSKYFDARNTITETLAFNNSFLGNDCNCESAFSMELPIIDCIVDDNSSSNATIFCINAISSFFISWESEIVAVDLILADSLVIGQSTLSLSNDGAHALCQREVVI